MTYAARTPVPIERSRGEIEQLVEAAGASQFMAGNDYDKGRAMVGWTMKGRMVRIEVPLPGKPKDNTPTNVRTWEQLCRSRWRAALLIIKAKFVAIESGVSTFEREFLADTVMADGHTVGMWIQPQLESMYKSGKMPALLPAIGETSK